MRAAAAAVLRIRDIEGALRGLLPAASRVVHHGRREAACKPIEGTHSQRPRLAWPGLVRVISSNGSQARLVLVEALDQRGATFVY